MSTREEAERQFTSELIRIARIYRKEINRNLHRYGLSDSQAVPVIHIARSGGGMRQNQLAEEIGIEGPSLARLLDQLCSQDLVERREDSNDRRAKNLHLTEQGEALAAKVEEVIADYRHQQLAGVSDDELATCLKVLATFIHQLQANS